jgi:hypothetical protein
MFIPFFPSMRTSINKPVQRDDSNTNKKQAHLGCCFASDKLLGLPPVLLSDPLQCEIPNETMDKLTSLQLAESCGFQHG